MTRSGGGTQVKCEHGPPDVVESARRRKKVSAALIDLTAED